MAEFSQAEIESIAKAIGDTESGLTNSEIDRLLFECNIDDPGPGTKWKRIVQALAESQRKEGDRRAILAFIRKSMKPSKYVDAPQRFEHLRARINKSLLFCGLILDEGGQIKQTNSALIPSLDEHDSSRLGKRDGAPAAKRGCLSVIGYDH
jgi:hypothetical protein